MAINYPAAADTPEKKLRFLGRMQRKLDAEEWTELGRQTKYQPLSSAYPDSFEVIDVAAVGSRTVLKPAGQYDDDGEIIPSGKAMVEAAWVPTFRIFQQKHERKTAKLLAEVNQIRTAAENDSLMPSNTLARRAWFEKMVGGSEEAWDSGIDMKELDD